jgi:hypothetical protein
MEETKSNLWLNKLGNLFLYEEITTLFYHIKGFKKYQTKQLFNLF